MPQVGVVANDSDFERWLSGPVHAELLVTETDGDDPVEVLQIAPGQALTGVGFNLIIVVTWPDDGDDPAEAMRWLHEEVAVCLEPGGLLAYEPAVPE